MNNTQQAGETANPFKEWLETKDGKSCMMPASFLQPRDMQYLENRLWWAYTAGMGKQLQDIQSLTPAPDAVEAKSAGVWQLCPKCNGQGAVSRPPWIAEGVRTFVSSETGFECNLCLGKMIIPRDAGTFETATSHAEAVTATERALAYAKGKHGDHDAWQVDRAASATDYLAGHAEGEKGAVGFGDWLRKQRPDVFYGNPTTEQLYQTYLKDLTC